jgi:hypothetical protein
VNSYGHNPDFTPPAKPALEKPGRHEALTLLVLFVSGCCAISSIEFRNELFLLPAALLMAIGVLGIWKSRSWTAETKSTSSILLLTLYFALAVIALVSLVGEYTAPASGIFFRLALLGIVFGVPAGIGAWVVLVIKTIRARAHAGRDDQDLAAA